MSENRNVASLLKAEDLAERWSVTERTVHYLRQRGELPCVRIGRQVRFRPDDVEAYEKSQLEQGDAA